MKKTKMNNSGFTLLEMIICFALLGILMVAAGQIISSSTQVYYYTKSVSYGVQASQIVATEVRGELEDALPQEIVNNEQNTGKLGIYSFVNSSINKNYSVYIKDDGSGIAFVNSDGNTIIYCLDDDSFSSKDIGMGYKISSLNFSLLDKVNDSSNSNILPGNNTINNYPVIKLDIVVNNPKYGDYSCTEYIPLYNFYGIDIETQNKIIYHS